MAHDLILGTAGHIDHGKTALVKALTGTDCDRLPEEKKRGITIELGFAELPLGEFRLGVVDVPGHERFVRNMLAGATGMDLVMLVVAADDSVKQQTREHVEILRLLNLQAGVIVLTKCDLVEANWLELVEAEIRELVAGTFLARAPIVRTSASTGAGLAELKLALLATAQQVAGGLNSRPAGPFRMAIDRTFTLAGHGTVVTGSVSSGTVRVGDMLVLEPGGVEVRVRGLQNHERPVAEAQRGQRAAINLAGVHHDQIARGQELATAGHLRPSKRLTVQLQMLASAPHPLKNRSRMRLHVGTAEILARAQLLDREKLEAGHTAPVQLFLASPAVTTWNQPFVVRSESPVVTLGGGRILDPDAEKIRHAEAPVLQRLGELGEPDELARAAAAIYFAGLRPWQPSDLARTAGISFPGEAVEKLIEQGQVLAVAATPVRKRLIHQSRLEEVAERVAERLGTLHAQFPLQLAFERVKLASEFAWLGDEVLFAAALSLLQKAGRLRSTARGLALSGQGPRLSQNEQKLFDWLVGRFLAAGFEPPSVKECQQEAAKLPAAVPQLLAVAVGAGELVEISTEFYLHATHERRLRELLTERMQGGAGLTVSEIREMLQTSRKYAVPLCEYLDRIGFTRRSGDTRLLVEPNVSPLS